MDATLATGELAISFLFGGATPPPPPPPPPAAPQLADPSIAQQGAAERARLASAEGEGFNNTDVTGGSSTAVPSNTTANPQKSLLGS